MGTKEELLQVCYGKEVMKMGLVDKLTELDEAIWKQYEKVTNYCNREYGWNKYDLARKTNTGMGISAVGTGVYGALEGMLASSPALIGTNLFCPMIAIGSYYLLKIRDEYQEKKEISQLEQLGDAIPAPQFYFSRPLVGGVGVFLGLVVSITSFLGLDKMSESLKPLSQDNYNTLGGLQGLGLASMVFFVVSTSYFEDQITTPPKKKKSVFKTVYEKVTGRIPTIPQLEPVKEPTKYLSINDVVGGA